MDIVYNLGPDLPNDGLELRMSLRSVAKYAKNVGKVILAGCPPPSDRWSDKVYMFPVEQKQDMPKHNRILDTIFSVIDAGLVKGEFLYSSDDHFLVKPVDFDAYPYYFKREKIRSFSDVVKEEGIHRWGPYFKSVADTATALARNGYGTVEFSCHANTHMNTEDAAEVRRVWMDEPRSYCGLEPTCLFMNIRDKRSPVKRVYRKDVKIWKFNGAEEFWKEVGDSDTFSIDDDIFKKPEFEEFLKSLYPEKSVYEL